MSKLIVATLLLTGAALQPAFPDEKEDHYREGTKGVSPEMIRPEYLDRMKLHNDQMKSHLKDMCKLMDRLHTTKDASERRKLMEEQAKSMRALMVDMRSTSTAR